MSRLDVRSREYKVMLQPAPFAGDLDDIRKVAARFWGDVRSALEPLEIPTDGAFDEIKARRRIRFLDSADDILNGQRYVFRVGADVRGSVARDAHDVLQALHRELTDWVHPKPVTKTALVYR